MKYLNSTAQIKVFNEETAGEISVTPSNSSIYDPLCVGLPFNASVDVFDVEGNRLAPGERGELSITSSSIILTRLICPLLQ